MEEVLVRQMKEGDKASFDLLYEKYKKLAFHTAYLITGNLPDREDVFEETVRRVLELMKVYAFETLHPNNAALFFYHAAVGYAGFGKERQAAAMLQRYWDAVQQLMLVDHAQLHGDNYFTEINSWFDGASKAAPRESNLVRESILQSMDHPAFQCLDKNKDFLRIRHEMERYAQDAQKHTEE